MVFGGLYMAKEYPNYCACDFYMLRTPMLSINDYFETFKNQTCLDGLSKVFSNFFLQEALLISSKALSSELSRAMERPTSNADGLMSSLIKYYIRITTRPTPFGMFSGISIGKFGNDSKVLISNPDQHIRRARPDMDWIYGVVKQIESDNKVKRYLQVRFNDFTFVHGNRIEKPNRTVLQHRTDELKDDTGNEVASSIRYTAAVKAVESMSQQYISFHSLQEYLCGLNPDVPSEQIEAFLSQLLENEFLISELRPPLLNTDFFEYLMAKLGGLPAESQADYWLKPLEKIRKKIIEYNSLHPGEGIKKYHEIIDLMKKIYKSNNFLQIDMKTSVKFNQLDRKLKSDLETFVSAMSQIAPLQKVPDELRYYTELFIEKYGYNNEVNVVELLDPDCGLGSPAHYDSGVVYSSVPRYEKNLKEIRLYSIIEQKTFSALRQGEHLIELTDEDIAVLRSLDEDNINRNAISNLQSFELYLLAHPATTTSSKEQRHFDFTLAPIIGSDSVGKSFGRFFDLFTEEESAMLSAAIDRQKQLLPDYIIAEATELPSSGRTSNVMMNASTYDYQINLASNPDDLKQVLSIQDLFIGVDQETNFFYIKSKSLNKRVLVTMTSMITPTFGSNVLRFLREVSALRKQKITDGIIDVFDIPYNYCPRVVYKNIIIKPETWLISQELLQINDKSKERFKERFYLYRQQNNMPRYVFLNEADNRLLLDLDNPIHVNEIYTALKKKHPRYKLALTEHTCRPDHYAAHDSSGCPYVSEIVVPFIQGCPTPTRDTKVTNTLPTYSNVSINRLRQTEVQNTLFPGEENWIYYKLYGCGKRQDELISLMDAAFDELKYNKVLKQYFFIRYSDPQPHMRVRLQHMPNRFSQMLYALQTILGSFRNDGLLTTVSIDTYQRESNRYGGVALISKAETYFSYESKFVAQVITDNRFKDLSRDALDCVAISYLTMMLKSFGMTLDVQETFLESVTTNKAYRKDFTTNRELFMRAVDDSANWRSIRSVLKREQLYELACYTSEKLKEYVAAVELYDSQGCLTNSIQNIAMSIIHMFANRLFGSREAEKRLYALTKHGIHAFRGYLKHHL